MKLYSNIILVTFLIILFFGCKKNEDVIGQEPGYYVDAIKGSDELGNGGKDNPFKTSRLKQGCVSTIATAKGLSRNLRKFLAAHNGLRGLGVVNYTLI